MQRVLSRLDQIEAKVDQCLEQSTRTNGRVTKLENLRWYAGGAISVIVLLIGIIETLKGAK